MSYHALLMEKFPVRRSRKEKEDFVAWVGEEAERLGWQAHTETTGKYKQTNLVIGDPDHAAIILGAHFDTPVNRLLPSIQLPCNPVMEILLQFLTFVLLLALGIAGDLVAGLFTQNMQIRAAAFLGVYVVLLLLLGYGPANKNNANESSGLACALQLMAQLPEDKRSKVAFVLFDGHHNGLIGSKGWARDHLELQFMRMFFDLDYIGAGDTMIFCAASMATRCTGYRTIERVLKEAEGREVRVVSSSRVLLNSDYKNMKCGICAVACKKLPVLGHIIGRLSTSRDTVCDQGNIDWLCDTLIRCVGTITKG